MIFNTTGFVRNDFAVAGISWTPCYVLLGNAGPVLFESGFSYAGKLYEDDIRRFAGESGNSEPKYLFLTHVHYDHCGATSYLKQKFSGLKVAASARAHDLINKQNILDLIKNLSANAAVVGESLPDIDTSRFLRETFEPFSIDIIVKDGDRIQIEDNLTIEVIASPGHTRDMLSYYVPEKKILIATEACGCMDRAGTIITEFLSDYNSYMDSLRRLANLDAEILCQGHHFVYAGAGEVRNFFSRSIKEACNFKDRVFELLSKKNGDIKEAIRIIKAEQYDTNTKIKQPEKAYLLNLNAQVEHLAKLFLGANNPHS